MFAPINAVSKQTVVYGRQVRFLLIEVSSNTSPNTHGGPTKNEANELIDVTSSKLSLFS